MTIKEVAKKIAEDFNNAVIEDGFENFKEMKRCYDWDATDIRNEIDAMLSCYKVGIMMLDDGTIVNVLDVFDPEYEISYGKFKKMIFENVK